MKKLCCAVLAMLLILCCATALAEQCKYYQEDSPCNVKWWVNTEKQQHARACFNHVEDKEDMDSHVLVTEWAPCTPDEGGECTVCGWDYIREPDATDYERYMLEYFYVYTEMQGQSPVKVEVSNGKLTITLDDGFFTFLDEMGVPYGEAMMVETEFSLAEVDGVWTVVRSEYGPVAWLEKYGKVNVGSVNVTDGVASAEIIVDGVSYPLTNGGSGDPGCSHSVWCGKPDTCKRCGATGLTVSQDAMEHYNSIYVDLGAEHQYQCPCGYEVYWSGEHLEFCDAPGVCDSCGIDISDRGLQIGHRWELLVWQHDDVCHWRACTGCGWQDDMTSHRGYCDADSVCEACKAENIVIENVWHRVEWKSTETDCWTECTSCGEADDPWPHRQRCSEPGKCTKCDRTDVVFGEEMQHDWDSPFEHTDTHHWRTCNECNEEFDRSQHYGSCNPGDKCHGCEATGIVIDYPWHEQDWKADENYCWNECPECGKVEDRWAHAQRCSVPGVCVRCGCDDVIFSELEHNWDSPFEHTEKNHWQICSDCGVEFGYSIHYGPCTNDGRCDGCGERDIVLTDIWHEEEWKSEGAFCWGECTRCDYVGTKQYHIARCKNPTECVNCGKMDVVIGDIEHDWGSPIESDENSHWRTCADCGEKFNQGTHYLSCKKPGVCADCGEAFTGNAWMAHNWSSPYEHNETEHWQICLDCGQEFDRMNHYYMCNEPGVCVACGEKDVTMFKDHPWSNNVQHDQYFCWRVCGMCGETIYKQNHRAQCINPNQCANCKSTDVMLGNVEHYNTITRKVDAQYHERYCIDCEKVVEKWEHVRYCTDPEDACIDCGAADVTIGDVYHDWRHQQPLYDKTHHWSKCDLCGEYDEKFVHYTNCKDEGCSYCQGEGVIIGVHFHSGTYQYDEKSHWIMCANCGEVPAQAHYFFDGHRCVQCGYKRTVLPGDASGDGQVDIMDALEVLQAAVGWGNAINSDAADVDGSGTVDIMDALLILQYAVGWDVEFK